MFQENKGCYGSIRIAKVLNNRGVHISRKRVSRLMRELKLYPKGI
ncbi:IS3 family transposase [Clostridium sporogenes]